MEAASQMVPLPVTYLRIIHQERVDEIASIARENEPMAGRPRVALRRRLGRAIARIGASIANEEACVLAS